MRGSVSTLKLRTASSKRSTQRKAVAWESGYPSVGPSSRVIMAAYGRQRTMVREPRFHFLSLDDPRVELASAVATSLGRLPGQRREESVMVKRSLVSVVDDDESVR